MALRGKCSSPRFAQALTCLLRRFAAQPAFATGSDSMSMVTQSALSEMDSAGTLKRERVLTSAQGPWIRVQDSPKQVLNFCANNYLGLGNHPAVVAAAKSALDSHGFGLASVRFICGTQDLHKRLEGTISNFHHTEDTILYASCFDANAGLFETLLTAEDAVISDSLNHASIIDGIRLCKVRNSCDCNRCNDCSKSSTLLAC